MDFDAEIIVKVFAVGVPALLIISGVILLLVSYPFNLGNEISGGWLLILIGVVIYLIEIGISAVQKGGGRGW